MAAHPAGVGEAGRPERIGPYVVEAELGRGAMGVVYRAADPVLGRTVAIKALPSVLERDPERLALLEREARMLASIVHPNIETIHDLLKTPDGGRYLVLEFVPGERLSDRLRRGALPIEEALRVVIEIAAALEAAHDRGVIHRDLKPSNVMLTEGGRVKVLDFGIARRAAAIPHRPATGDGAVEDPTTVTTIELGAGTPGYASPEQMRGEPHDRRVDLFGLGCILFECLSGRRAFAAPTPAGAMAAVLLAEPSWKALPPGVPAAVRDLLDRCLRKDPAHRLHDAGNARLILESALRSRGDRGGTERPAEPAPAPPAGPRHAAGNVPRPLTRLIGRTRETALLHELLGRARLVTLTGPGGCGKTRLAVAVAEAELGSGRDAVWFVDLASVVAPERVPLAVCAAAGVRERADRPPEEALCDAWTGRSILLVLDNCEHLRESVARMAESLLARLESLQVMATSREPLHVAGEQILPVPPLAVRPADAKHPDPAEAAPPPSEAAELFAERAAAVRPGFRIAAPNAALVEAICRELDGLPLAIELAAARTRVLSLETIRARLHDRFALLTGGSRGALARHQTLRATIDWSYGLLDEAEQRLLRLISVFAGGFSLSQAGAMADDGLREMEVLNLLTRLVEKSLLSAETPRREGEPSADGVRFRLLDTVREYAHARLEEAREGDPARDRHAAITIAFAERARTELMGPGQATWLQRLEVDHENLLAAMAWCERRTDKAVDALALADALWRFWMVHGHFRLGRALLRLAISRAGEGAPRALRADALLGAGALAFHQNDWVAAETHYGDALKILVPADDDALRGHGWSGLGNVALGRGAYEVARRNYETALGYYSKTGHRRGLGVVWSNLGRVAELCGDRDEARRLYRLGLDVFREVGDLASLAVRLSSLAELELRSGDPAAARRLLTECIPVVVSLRERRAAAYALERVSLLAEHVRDPWTAARFAGAAGAIRHQIASPLTPAEESEVRSLLARLSAELGPERYAVGWTAGQALAFEDALTQALAWLEASGATPRG